VLIDEWLAKLGGFVEDICARPISAATCIEVIVTELHRKRKQKLREDTEDFETYLRIIRFIFCGFSKFAGKKRGLSPCIGRAKKLLLSIDALNASALADSHITDLHSLFERSQFICPLRHEFLCHNPL